MLLVLWINTSYLCRTDCCTTASLSCYPADSLTQSCFSLLLVSGLFQAPDHAGDHDHRLDDAAVVVVVVIVIVSALLLAGFLDHDAGWAARARRQRPARSRVRVGRR